MDKQQTTKNMIENGGKLWEKGEMCRVYFDIEIVVKLGGLHTSHYNTGNVSSATLDGEAISNSEAKRIWSDLTYTKVYLEMSDGKFYFKNLGDSSSNSRAILKKFFGIAQTWIAQ